MNTGIYFQLPGHPDGGFGLSVLGSLNGARSLIPFAEVARYGGRITPGSFGLEISTTGASLRQMLDPSNLTTSGDLTIIRGGVGTSTDLLGNRGYSLNFGVGISASIDTEIDDAPFSQYEFFGLSR